MQRKFIQRGVVSTSAFPLELFAGTKNTAAEMLFITVDRNCDQENRAANLDGDKADGWVLMRLQGHLHGSPYERRFHVGSGQDVFLPVAHLKDMSLEILESSAEDWNVSASLIEKESCSLTPTPIFLHVDEPVGTYRVPSGAIELVSETEDPAFHWRTRYSDDGKAPGRLVRPLSTAVPTPVLSAFYQTTTRLRGMWRITP